MIIYDKIGSPFANHHGSSQAHRVSLADAYSLVMACLDERGGCGGKTASFSQSRISGWLGCYQMTKLESGYDTNGFMTYTTEQGRGNSDRADNLQTIS